MGNIAITSNDGRIKTETFVNENHIFDFLCKKYEYFKRTSLLICLFVFMDVQDLTVTSDIDTGRLTAGRDS